MNIFIIGSCRTSTCSPGQVLAPGHADFYQPEPLSHLAGQLQVYVARTLAG
ncbi:hypothetical protein [Actinomadura sp. NTSP31]|uniref:hypothetical protein n=1 Tax=Actinomadura sp. NTSP31 TaxID=1735447 RepID=UPI0035BF7F50